MTDENAGSVTARRAGPGERAWLWCRQNPAVAALSVAVIIMLVATALASTAQAVRVVRIHQQADVAVRKAEQARRDAEVKLEQALEEIERLKAAATKPD